MYVAIIFSLADGVAEMVPAAVESAMTSLMKRLQKEATLAKQMTGKTATMILQHFYASMLYM